VSLATDEIRTLLARLDVMVVRAGIAIDHRAIGVIDEIIACVKDIEDSDKRLPCRCHLNDEEYPNG
jgi:hypothetical protein